MKLTFICTKAETAGLAANIASRLARKRGIENFVAYYYDLDSLRNGNGQIKQVLKSSDKILLEADDMREDLKYYGFTTLDKQVAVIPFDSTKRNLSKELTFLIGRNLSCLSIQARPHPQLHLPVQASISFSLPLIKFQSSFINCLTAGLSVLSLYKSDLPTLLVFITILFFSSLFQKVCKVE